MTFNDLNSHYNIARHTAMPYRKKAERGKITQFQQKKSLNIAVPPPSPENTTSNII